MTFVRLSGDPLRPVERAALAAVAEKLEPSAQELFRKQIDVINTVQRHTRDREVNLYATRGGRVSFDEALRFPSRVPEARLATVIIKGPGAKDIRADVWLANGRVFSLTFDEPPVVASDRPVQIASVKLYLDPMRVEDRSPSGVDAGLVSRWLGQIAKDLPLSDVLGPPKEGIVQGRVAEFESELASDLIEMFKLTGGFKIGDCVVHGIDGARSIMLDDGEYVVVAERPGAELIAFRRGAPNSMLFLLRHDQREPLALGDSFREALSRLCSGR